MKQTALSQIPGLRYSSHALANLPRPPSWDDTALSAAAKQSVKFVELGHAVFEPRKFQPADLDEDTLDSRLLPLCAFCETRDVATVVSLGDAPPRTQQLLKDHQLLPEIQKYLHARRIFRSLGGENVVRIWADAEERREMKECHSRSIDILKRFLGPIQSRSLFRALDVAGGDGRLSVGFLLNSYARVDLFDQCPEAVKRAKRAM